MEDDVGETNFSAVSTAVLKELLLFVEYEARARYDGSDLLNNLELILGVYSMVVGYNGFPPSSCMYVCMYIYTSVCLCV